ncbi:helix-turn-helix domain-containing protein [Nocardia neocaledoniensis]|uniref:helix-turn-helix domain-containing protein n=1 Tax=Nocardia neocaledoniensis TaxID=236511 RepID=UPI0024590489|nr:helix-turn-helix domain-containing protein [Nocardia neocaledoniensis]
MHGSPPTERVVAVVELLTRTRTPRTAAAVADALGLSRSTVAAILTTLEERQWVRRGPDLTYRPGPALPGSTARADLPPEAAAELRALADRVGCGAALSVVTPSALTFVALAAHNGRVPAGVTVGTRLPLRAPAAASVIAFAGPDRQRAWLDSADPTQRRELTDALIEIRATGVAVWGIDPADLGTLDVLAEVAGHLADSPTTGPLRRRVLGLLAGLSGYPHTVADLDSARDLPVAYLAAPVFDADDLPRWELQLGPLRAAVTRPERDHYRAELLAAARRLTLRP